MADIADAKANINDIEVDADAALSEALFEKIGGAINYLNTTTDTHTTQINNLQAFASGSSLVSYSFSSNTSTSEETGYTSGSITVPTGGRVIFWFTGAENSGFPVGGGTEPISFLAFTNMSFPVNCTFRWKRDSTTLESRTINSAGAAATYRYINGNWVYIDTPSAGTYTYTLTHQYATGSTGNSFSIQGRISYIVLPS